MAMSSNVYLTAASGSPFPQNRNSERVKHILKEFKPTPASTQNWSISQKQTVISGPLKHRRTINTDDSDFEFAEKLKTTKHFLRKEGEDPIQGLAMIDAIQRLSIDYHFREEIDSILARQSMLSSTFLSDNNLYENALRFRLLRQQGYHVSAEAWRVSWPKTILMMSQMDGVVSYKNLQRQFEMVKSRHQLEVVEISKWWKDLGLSKEIKFARDQPLKWYMWSMSCLADPCLSEQRIELTKPISMIYIIDDIFDVYGTLDELVCFTEVINRWDIAAAEHLPDYMKICFKALDNITDEISYEIYKKHGWNPVDSLRKTWTGLCNAFLVEAKWFASGKLPSSEEYLKNGIVSSGVNVVLVHIFFLLGQGISKENVELINNFPAIISSTATILRLWDDLGSAKDENQDGHDGSYVECYRKENEGSSCEDARNQVLHMISDAWKQLNQECLSPSPFSATFSKASLNIARMVPLMYNYDDNHRLPNLEEHMKSLLYENVSL
ncbi:hypothetical protein SADUNF_Sadunf11G0018000 [Salix dunnii]|uniref:Uncharacterized protein n=1 Tax=Salix dunnii TaxID=1413687 RepID=A0A835JSJ4_9ROSI|nr:hypothetical protein SADUNF_Sadunf11G0018000 [Salix dunnii]